ncbi:tyrosine-type recombinase/integrase [Lentzea tibetensis]|nr:site-specific integrase [Lentzea tibetensis]
MARRANGEGSIYRRKDGRYEAALYVFTPSGKRKRFRIYGKRRVEVAEKLAEAKVDLIQGIPTAERTWKLGEYLDHWLETVVQPSRRPTTYVRYEGVVRIHLKPGLGNYSLRKLSVQVVQFFVNQQIEAGCSIRTAQVMRAVLRAALNRAKREELVGRNVAELVELPGYRKGAITPWTVGEARQFLQAATGDSLYPLFILLLVYGLRVGESVGLRWSDINLDRLIFQTRQQIQRVAGALRVGPVKTQAGERDFPLLPAARDELLKCRAKQLEARREAGEAWQGTDDAHELVFTTRTGNPIEPRNVARSFQRICARHGIRRTKLHHTKHFTGTLLKDFGASVKDAQIILGHSNVSTTLQIYTHGTAEAQRDVLTKVGVALLSQQTDDRAKERGRHSAGRCRQLLPSNSKIVDRITSFLSGSSDWDRTSDLRLMRSTGDTVFDRSTEVKLVTKRVTRQWMLGAVAVSVAVKRR